MPIGSSSFSSSAAAKATAIIAFLTQVPIASPLSLASRKFFQHGYREVCQVPQAPQVQSPPQAQFYPRRQRHTNEFCHYSRCLNSNLFTLFSKPEGRSNVDDSVDDNDNGNDNDDENEKNVLFQDDEELFLLMNEKKEQQKIQQENEFNKIAVADLFDKNGGAGSPRASLHPGQVAPLLMTALQNNDFPEVDSGLRSIWEFSTDVTKFVFHNNVTGKFRLPQKKKDAKYANISSILSVLLVIVRAING